MKQQNSFKFNVGSSNQLKVQSTFFNTANVFWLCHSLSYSSLVPS